MAERHGILGVVVGQEVTLSRAAGWHYHQHLSIPVDGPTDEEAEAAGGDPDTLAALVRARAQAAGEAVAERYKAAIRAAGGRVSDEHGVYVRVAENDADAAGYTAKGSLAWEVAGGPTKEASRSEVSMTPWNLAEAAYGGDAWARARWAEYVETMPGTRSCVVSSALAKALDISAADDQEEGEQVLHEADEVVGRVEAPTWRRWLRHGLGSTFLARVEHGGEAGFEAAVARTDKEADAIEAGYAARDAERQARRVARGQDAGLAEAVARIQCAPGAGTRNRIRRVLADLAAQNPDRALPDEAAVITALAAVGPDDAAQIQEIARRLGGRVVDLGIAA